MFVKGHGVGALIRAKPLFCALQRAHQMFFSLNVLRPICKLLDTTLNVFYRIYLSFSPITMK